MTTSSIPVDLFNPGQVFACLGFMEVAELLFGGVEGGFDWSDPNGVRFALQADCDGNPYERVLDKLAQAACGEVEPKGWPGKRVKQALVTDCFPSPLTHHYDKKGKKWTRTSFPFEIAIGLEEQSGGTVLSNWSDGSSRPLFKLYSGNRSAHYIASKILLGRGAKSKSFRQLWHEQRAQLIESPFGVLCSMGGSFNLDPRGGCPALDVGFSPDQQSALLDGVAASPVVAILALWGLEHARPDEYETRQVRYGIWSGLVPTMLARAALSGAEVIKPIRRFRFTLALSGKNKVVTFATEERD